MQGPSPSSCGCDNVTFPSLLLQPREHVAGSLQTPMDAPHLLVFMALCNSFFLLSNLLLTTRIQQHCRAVTSTVRYKGL